jgi:hypothetical protein
MSVEMSLLLGKLLDNEEPWREYSTYGAQTRASISAPLTHLTREALLRPSAEDFDPGVGRTVFYPPAEVSEHLIVPAGTLYDWHDEELLNYPAYRYGLGLHVTARGDRWTEYGFSWPYRRNHVECWGARTLLLDPRRDIEAIWHFGGVSLFVDDWTEWTFWRTGDSGEELIPSITLRELVDRMSRRTVDYADLIGSPRTLTEVVTKYVRPRSSVTSS